MWSREEEWAHSAVTLPKILRIPYLHWISTKCLSFQGGWNRGVLLYTKMSSFQGVGIEGFHCIQRCSHFGGGGGWNREVSLYTEMSSFQGVGIEGFHCI